MRKKNLLIAYDIRSPLRLGRLHRYLKQEAIAVQYSIFVTRKNQTALSEMIDRINERIDPGEDDVRIYELPTDYQVEMLGEPPLDDGYLLQIGGLERMLQKPVEK